MECSWIFPNRGCPPTHPHETILVLKHLWFWGCPAWSTAIWSQQMDTGSQMQKRYFVLC